MGFALWIEKDSPETGLVWAQGTHEYKPMGSAVISLSDLFRQKDFGRGRRCPTRLDPRFVGLFGSLVDVNAYLRTLKPGPRKSRRPDRLTRQLL